MNLGEIQNLFKSALNKLYDAGESGAIVRTVLKEVLNFSSADLLLKDKEAILFAQEVQLLKILERLKQSEPLQYVLGYAWFCGLKLKVNKHVLIPRPETEELVDWIVKENKIQSAHILDVGTGSGCIALALADQMPSAKVFAMDVWRDAIEIAKQNTLLNRLEVQFILDDILIPKKNDFQFDLMVSNPPYVLHSEKETIDKHVLEYEPHAALFVSDNDALVYYKAIVNYADLNLKPGGKLYFEINPSKANEMVTLLEARNYRDNVIQKDLHGKERMIKGTKS